MKAVIFCHVMQLRKRDYECDLGGLKLHVWPVLTWTGSSESLSSPREPRGPGKPLGLSSSEWHCNTKRKTVRTMLMRPISGDDKTLSTPSGMEVLKSGLTWSRSPRSGSWQESAPPSQCGGRLVFSLFGCSGSAAPLPGSLLGDRCHMVTKCNSLYSWVLMRCQQNVSK